MIYVNIYGDNIIECERIIILLKNTFPNFLIEKISINGACICYEVSMDNSKFFYTLYPGFNKNNSNTRWDKDILESIDQSKNFLNENPDVIITLFENNKNIPLLALEFCSALQAGNQAWQRSGRAYSVSRADLPYLYLVDFVKYELDENRKRKSLRFPNAILPYSFINQSKNQSFCCQCFFKSEEFQPNYDSKLKNFDNSIFSEKEVAEFILSKILKKETQILENILVGKLKEMMIFLNSNQSEHNLLDLANTDLISFSKQGLLEPFTKKIAEKSITGNIIKLKGIIKKYSRKIISKDLPFGLIPKENRKNFEEELKLLYNIENNLITEETDLIICLIKGFKPKGDDNRPDRGILPLIRMSTDENIEIMTVIYGPIIKSNLDLLQKNSLKLASNNGLWKTIISLSNYILIDAPVLDKENNNNIQIYIENNNNVKIFLKNIENKEKIIGEIATIPKKMQENDVDTVIHYLFKKLKAFEGMCNPPGGDWSGISLYNNFEYRWMSLNRVSKGKRPDHVLQLFNIEGENFILAIESKEKFSDLEENIGNELKFYITELISYEPSVIKKFNDWTILKENIFPIKNYNLISVGVFYEEIETNFIEKNKEWKCDLIFSLKFNKNQWFLTIHSFCEKGIIIKKHIESFLPFYSIE